MNAMLADVTRSSSKPMKVIRITSSVTVLSHRHPDWPKAPLFIFYNSNNFLYSWMNLGRKIKLTFTFTKRLDIARCCGVFFFGWPVMPQQCARLWLKISPGWVIVSLCEEKKKLEMTSDRNFRCLIFSCCVIVKNFWLKIKITSSDMFGDLQKWWQVRVRDVFDKKNEAGSCRSKVCREFRVQVVDSADSVRWSH